MKFKVNSTELNAKLNALSRVISSKNSMQILDCIRFDISGSSLVMTASDNAVCMKTTLELLECDGNATFCVQAKKISSMVKEMSDQPLEFDVNTDTYAIVMKYANGSFKIIGQSAEEYPAMQGVEGESHTLTLDAKSLNAIIGRTMFATAEDELRMVMNGIYFDAKEDYLNVVATDGHKLVRTSVMSCKSEIPSSFIMPKKPCNILRNTLPVDETEVEICFNDNTSEVKYGDTQITCRLIEGRYPNYNAVIPQNNPFEIVVDRKSFIGTLKRVAPFASESTQLMKLALELGNMEVSAEDIDFATSARENVPCSYDGAPMAIGFKLSVVMEACNNLTSDNIIFKLSDPSRAGIIVPDVQTEGEDTLVLVMPMLLN